jgi:hypothetical protein
VGFHGSDADLANIFGQSGVVHYGWAVLGTPLTATLNVFAGTPNLNSQAHDFSKRNWFVSQKHCLYFNPELLQTQISGTRVCGWPDRVWQRPGSRGGLSKEGSARRTSVLRLLLENTP